MKLGVNVPVSSVLKSNIAALEEFARISSYLASEGIKCPNKEGPTYIAELFEPAVKKRTKEMYGTSTVC